MGSVWALKCLNGMCILLRTSERSAAHTLETERAPAWCVGWGSRCVVVCDTETVPHLHHESTGLVCEVWCGRVPRFPGFVDWMCCASNASASLRYNDAHAAA